MQPQEKINKYIFQAEISTPQDLLHEGYKSFLDEMLKMDTSNLSDEELNFFLDQMDFSLDVRGKSIILTYQNEKS